MIDLNNRHILIAGGDTSLIKGVAGQLHSAGATITIAHREPELANLLVSDLNCHMLTVDWGNLENVSDVLADADPIHGIVICPDWHKTGRFVDTSPTDWDDALQMNYESAVYWSQATARHMIDNGIAGSIVFLTSVAILMPFVDTSVIGTSSAPLRPLAKMAAVDCGHYGIRTNMIAMGWIDTDFNRKFLTGTGQAFIEEGIPLQQIGTPESIGDVCCFLMSDLSRYMTGSVLTVDGGYTLTRSEGQSPYPTSD